MPTLLCCRCRPNGPTRRPSSSTKSPATTSVVRPWYWNWFKTGEHTGTHFDAPVHWVSGKDLDSNSVGTIPVRSFVGQASVLDATAESAENPDFLIDVDFIRAWEGRHGQIPERSWVLLRTDWSGRTGEEFLNIDDKGPHTPGWKKEASLFLAEERDVLGVGVETIGTDAGQAAGFDPPFSNHYVMHGHGKFGLTNLINLDRLPPTGSVVIAAPLKIVGGSGSPVAGHRSGTKDELISRALLYSTRPKRMS